MNIRDFVSVTKRRKAIEDKVGVRLPHIGHFSLDEKTASSRNCENMIGAVQVPLGIAGPLSLKSSLQERDVLVPLATTEGALVASMNRGCKAIEKAGGARVVSKRVGISRAPVFAVSTVEEGKETIDWIEKNTSLLAQVGEATSSHLTLLSLKQWLVGRNLYVHLSFDTKDAMGMNMATIAATEMAKTIEKNTKAKLVAISGNLCVDKKPNTLNMILGRGIQVWADVILSEEILADILKTTPEKFIEVVNRKIYVGSILSGTTGANAHAANVLSAIFLATGQDMAHIAEASSVITTAERIDNGVSVSITLLDLPVGTVGGGTGLSTQKECLSLLGVAGGDNGKNALKFAEIIGASILAGEISLIASLGSNTLAIAHKKLGRGEK